MAGRRGETAFLLLHSFVPSAQPAGLLATNLTQKHKSAVKLKSFKKQNKSNGSLPRIGKKLQSGYWALLSMTAVKVEKNCVSPRLLVQTTV